MKRKPTSEKEEEEVEKTIIAVKAYKIKHVRLQVNNKKSISLHTLHTSASSSRLKLFFCCEKERKKYETNSAKTSPGIFRYV